MKRGRENLEDVRLLYENASGRRDVGAVPSAKRWKRFVVRRVQSLLTNYFVAPKSLPAPRPFEPRADEDEDEAVDIEVDAPATPSHGESALTRYFSWSRRRPDHWPERPVRRSSLELRSASRSRASSEPEPNHAGRDPHHPLDVRRRRRRRRRFGEAPGDLRRAGRSSKRGRDSPTRRLGILIGECPLCAKSFHPALLHAHVDQCFGVPDPPPAARAETKTETNTEAHEAISNAEADTDAAERESRLFDGTSRLFDGTIRRFVTLRRRNRDRTHASRIRGVRGVDASATRRDV